MTMNAQACPECSRVISAQGLPNHRRFVHRATLGSTVSTASPGEGEGGLGSVVALLLIVAAGVGVVVLVVTYTLRRCPQCERLSIVRRDQAVTACPKCQAAIT